LQYSAIPRIARYVPPESSVYAFASSLRSVWVAADPHVGRFFRAAPAPKDKKKKADARIAEKTAQDIKKMFRDSGIELAEPEDLSKLGIDPDAAAAGARVNAGGSWRQPGSSSARRSYRSSALRAQASASTRSTRAANGTSPFRAMRPRC
jgi:hypothetical protein